MTREEAIETIRKNWPDTSYSQLREALKTVIPELTENEDEKIRKEIVGVIQKHYPNTPESYRWITYLERQKENNEYVFRPLAGTDISIAAEQAIRRADKGDRLVLAFNGAYIPVRKGCNVNKIVDIYDAFIEKQKEEEGYEAIPVESTLEYKLGFKAGKESEKQEGASKAIEAVDRIDKYIDRHLANAHDMKDSNPDKKYYRGWDDALGKMAGILQDVYSDEKQKERKPVPKFSVSDYVIDTNYKGEPLYQIVGTDKECYICEYRGDKEIGDRAVMHFAFDNPYLRLEQKPSDLPAGFYVTLPDGRKYYTKEMRCNGMNVKVVEPKPAEWSEEDERVIRDACCWIAEYAGFLMSENKDKAEMLWKLSEKLKSLRPQPQHRDTYYDIIHNILDMLKDMDFMKITPEHRVSLLNDIRVKCKNADECAAILDEPSWKPSEEQMKSLAHAIQVLNSNPHPRSAKAYQDLQTLYKNIKYGN